jgi:hypothetical protein
MISKKKFYNDEKIFLLLIFLTFRKFYAVTKDNKMNVFLEQNNFF